MRAFAAALVLLALAGCGDRRLFDERYADTEREIEQRAQNLDAALNETDSNRAAQPQAPSQ